MNELNKDFIRIDHPLIDKDGTIRNGFYGQIKLEDQEPTSIQREILDGYHKEDYIVFYGSITEICDILKHCSVSKL